MEENKRSNLFFIIFFTLLAVVLIVVAFIILTGNKKCPFIITQILTVSTAQGIEKEHTTEAWILSLMQSNDVYISLKENKGFNRSNQKLLKITLENFNVRNALEGANIEFYMPANFESSTFEMANEYKIEKKVEYIKTENQENIKDFFGMVCFRQTRKDIADYNYTEKELVQDGKLLQLAGITEEELNLIISFDMILETEEGNAYKSNISINVPAKDLLEKGMGTAENSDLQDIEFEKI